MSQIAGYAKKYKDSSLEQLFIHFRKHIVKHDNNKQNIVDVCESIIDECKNKREVTLFISVFFHVITETGKYYTPLSKACKGYYKEVFINKLKSKYMRRLEECVKDKTHLDHFRNLFNTYIKVMVVNHV